MLWYTGGIAEAITVSKAKGAIFVVYIEGKNNQSVEITNLIENGELGRKLENEHFVAIKLEAGSVPHQQFSEIYKEPSVPSIYFIGKNGAPLDIITGEDDLKLTSERVEKVLQRAGITVTSSAAELSQSFIQSEQTPPQSNIASEGSNTATGQSEDLNESSVPLASPSNVVCEDGVCTIKGESPDVTVSASEETTQSLTAEEKVDRAKDLLQKKREEKEKEEKEKEFQKEIERRKMGQNVQQLKRWQEDQELKQIVEERERERRENQLARERVLAQIAQDKAERLSKSSHTKPVPSEANKPSVSSPTKTNSTTTRLQFKLPDGSSGTQEFANSDSLQTVVTYIRTNMTLPFSNFRLSTTFPRREFVENDYSQSLLDLQLTPNAVILVLPVNRGTVSTSQGSGLTGLIWSLFTPIFQIFGFLRNFIFGTNTNVGGNKRQASESPKPVRPRQRPKDSTVVKKQGNVHRLTDRRDSDDDSNNTWNGNSTQQM